ncbi:MAG: hypothetical protein ABI551_09480, partial [Polyangiaceae bacterium]
MSKLPILLVTVSLSLAACGGGQARPLPPEEPMDKSGDSTSSSATSSTSTTSATDDPSSADPSAALAGASDPSAAATPTTDPTPAADPKGKGKKGKGKGKGELSAAECDQISDHELDVIVLSAGIDPSMKEMLKQQAASDPNLAGMKSEC